MKFTERQEDIRQMLGLDTEQAEVFFAGCRNATGVEEVLTVSIGETGQGKTHRAYRAIELADKQSNGGDNACDSE